MAILFEMRGATEVQRFLRGAAGRARAPQAALKNVGEEALLQNARRLAAGLDVDGHRMKPSRRAEQDGGQTLFASGTLATSLNYEARDNVLDLFSTDKRARVHYEGLTIKPTAGHMFLTIPVRARGGLFQTGNLSTAANRTGARAGHFKGTFFLRRKGKLLLMQRDKGHALRLLFILVRSVKMPRRRWMGFGAAELAFAVRRLGIHVTGGTGGGSQ